MDPKYLSPDPEQPEGLLEWAQAEAATADDIGGVFQRFCRLHGITPRLAVALANLWLKQEQVTRLQAMHAGHPRSNGGSAPTTSNENGQPMDPKYVSPDPETGATHVDYPDLVVSRDDDAGPDQA